MMARAAVFCGASSCGRHPCALSLPTTATHEWPWPREVASPAQVRLPRARRGSCACPRAGTLGAADRLCRSSVSRSQRRGAKTSRSAASNWLSATSFSRSMICTPVVQAKPCPDYMSSDNSLSVLGSAASPARPPACPSLAPLVGWLTTAGGARLLWPRAARQKRRSIEWHFCHSRAFSGANMHSF
jgi:hypothetical protein